MAGRLSFTVSSPPSTSRVTLTLSPSTSILLANVPCGRPSNAASIWPVWLLSSSIACLPRITRPGVSSSTTLASSLATPSGSTSVSLTIRIARRSEEHTSELQSLMRISYAVFCLKKKKKNNKHHPEHAVYITEITTKQDSTNIH